MIPWIKSVSIEKVSARIPTVKAAHLCVSDQIVVATTPYSPCLPNLDNSSKCHENFAHVSWFTGVPYSPPPYGSPFPPPRCPSPHRPPAAPSRGCTWLRHSYATD
ncbi:hypothetical protein K466DRAFT_198397 [Polyporus arcularius HHB13444]|uniref:Uncharacterized protein n=1 Tax=Polyporus arcularius HHB13444 TaxID=1314778 RepID=A0A5C3P6C0_9APHY|nr:hypothetical protein K466DRAFT_198397 [Polyporus arcularius HHB13444]